MRATAKTGKIGARPRGGAQWAPGHTECREVREAMSKIRVLLVEDDEADALLARVMLRDAREPQFEIELVTNYEDALAKMTGPACAYDVFILDYQLAAHSGLDLMIAAKTAGRSEPIILLTGKGAFS